uniref:Uncharacterized protein n=1 Tax=Panagrolaimus superbus TaxID=310955 RepID=A0A914Y8G7_9BILA
MAGTDVHGCKTIKITCTTAKVGEEVIFFFSNGAVDLGTASGTTTVSRILTCDENAKFLLTDGENTRAVGSVECITARAPPGMIILISNIL